MRCSKPSQVLSLKISPPPSPPPPRPTNRPQSPEYICCSATLVVVMQPTHSFETRLRYRVRLDPPDARFTEYIEEILQRTCAIDHKDTRGWPGRLGKEKCG